MTVVIVTGTGTSVGKTIATAALACHARSIGLDVAVCKPVQTGTVDGDDDLAEIGRLAGVTELVGGARYPQPLGPVAAAEQAGMRLLDRAELLAMIRAADRPGRLTLIEGAGGLLVELGADGVTLRDIAVDCGASVLVVVAPGLGTLNHTALTLEALAAKQLSCAGLIVGSWPDDPGLAERSNRAALPALAPVRAVLPAGAGALGIAEFASLASDAFDSAWVENLI